jgi:hypothetical protein
MKMPTRPPALSDPTSSAMVSHEIPVGSNSHCKRGLRWDIDTIFPIFIQSPNGNPSILGNEPDELLSNVLDLIILLKAANVCLYCGLGWLAAACVSKMSICDASFAGMPHAVTYLRCDLSSATSLAVLSSERIVS